jgi:hypothetical protein
VKFKNWEYWPSYLFYIPLLPYAFYLAIKTRSFAFFYAANPGIEESGNGLESKFGTLLKIPEKYIPKSILIKPEDTFDIIVKNIELSKIDFPLIIKPDIGFRGLLVKKINSRDDLSSYLNKYQATNLIVQEYVNLKNECGIFYYKIPGKSKGVITSITLKKYLTVTGNGVSTIEELIKSDKRASIYYNLLKPILKDTIKYIPKKNEKKVLTVIGNHSKGTQFIDGNHLISEELEVAFDEICNQIKGWYYGRIDLKYDTFEELIQLNNFKIIEVNGIISEPTHIYDASTGTYLKALFEIKKHWAILSEISKRNKKRNEGDYKGFKYLINLYFRYKKYLKFIQTLTTN